MQFQNNLQLGTPVVTILKGHNKVRNKIWNVGTRNNKIGALKTGIPKTRTLKTGTPKTWKLKNRDL